jgi:hypothetical protein
VLTPCARHSPIKLAMQLAHAGRKASSRAPWEGGAQIRSASRAAGAPSPPSAVPHGAGEDAPAALDAAGLQKIRDDFARRARAPTLGLDALEIHAAHGYLLHQFLSPIANKRDGRIRRQPREPDALSARGLRRRRCRVSGRQARLGADLGDRLGAGGWDIEGTRRALEGAAGARLRRDPCLERRSSRRSRRFQSARATRCRSRSASRPRSACRRSPSA